MGLAAAFWAWRARRDEFLEVRSDLMDNVIAIDAPSPRRPDPAPEFALALADDKVAVDVPVRLSAEVRLARGSGT